MREVQRTKKRNRREIVGFFEYSSGEGKTPIELFFKGVQDWSPGLKQFFSTLRWMRDRRANKKFSRSARH